MPLAIHLIVIAATNAAGLTASGPASMPAATPPRASADRTALVERGILFYLPFEGSAEALIARGPSHPWLAQNLAYVPGPVGQAVHLQTKQAMIGYLMRGNLLPEQGTLAFWIRTPWDASDRNLLTGSSLTGPQPISISSRSVYPPFLHFFRHKDWFNLGFGGRDAGGQVERFGFMLSQMVPLWTKDQWHHVAITWDRRRGLAVFFDGQELARLEEPMDWRMN